MNTINSEKFMLTEFVRKAANYADIIMPIKSIQTS